MNTEDIRTICLGLKGATEDIKWGHDLVFSIGDKMFCVVGMDEVPVSASFKVPNEDFDELSSQAGFRPAPYVARYKWVLVDDINILPKKRLEKFLNESYRLVKEKLPAKIKKSLGV